MLEVSALESRYGRIPALKGIDLAVRAGELVALVGANGAGKTTLLRTLSGVQPASAGRVRYEGADITATAPERRVPATHAADWSTRTVPDGWSRTWSPAHRRSPVGVS